MDESVEKEVDSLMAAYSGAGEPGASVLVFRDDEVLFRKAYGLADLENNIAISSATNFRLASVTKQFTAAAILKLVAQGSLSLDQKLTEVFENFPEYGNSVSIQHLLTHTSGLVDYEDVMPDTTTVPILDSGVLELMRKQDSTDFEPGSLYRYSNTAYALLALTVERVSGVSFATFLMDSLFVPVGMRSTVAFEEGRSTVKNRAFGYSIADSGFERTDQSMTSSVLGDGGVYSSVDDLHKWYSALDAGAVLPGELFTESTKAQPGTEHDDEAGYGYGWFVEVYRGRKCVRHSGSTIGFRNDVERFPEIGLTVIVLTNRNSPDVEKVARQIADLFLTSGGRTGS